MSAPADRQAGPAFWVRPGLRRFRDQQDLMERPFFSLAKTPRTVPIRYSVGGVEVEVRGMPGVGMATIWDADVLIWAGSQVVEALDAGMTPSRRLRFTPYELLPAIGRPVGQSQYLLLKAALHRLQSTVIRTSIRQGKSQRRRQFGWLDEWSELSTEDGRTRGMEIVLADWFWRGVVDRTLVLGIDPAYFRLTGGIERWLYRIARKHAGRQRRGWSFEVAHLHAKSGSLARLSDFRLSLARLVRRQSLPGYRLSLEISPEGVELLRVEAVDKYVGKPVEEM